METTYNNIIGTTSSFFGGNTMINTTFSALANRPLSYLNINDNINTNYKTNPLASDDIYKTGNIPINSKFNTTNNKLVPIEIKQGNNNEYTVVENKELNDSTMDLSNNDKIITNLPLPQDKQKTSTANKMNLSTSLYIGSLTIIGLFVFYRLIQKTR